jgi:hypothetical protein
VSSRTRSAAAAVIVAGDRPRRRRPLRALAPGDARGARLPDRQRLIGPLDSSSLSGFRVFPSFDCLTYKRGANVFALELCVDHAGRVVEAIDRRSFDRRIWSLRFDPPRPPTASTGQRSTAC